MLGQLPGKGGLGQVRGLTGVRAQAAGDQGEKIQAFREVLTPMRQTLEQFRFLGKEEPAIADILMFSMFLVRSPAAPVGQLAAGVPMPSWVPAQGVACGPCGARLTPSGAMQWAKAAVSAALLEQGDPVAAWHGRMSERYAGCLQGLLQYPGC